MKLALIVVVAVGACGGGPGPARGPDYTPVGSPEAASDCPDEWQQAKKEREQLVGNDSSAARERTARAVLTQADCERGLVAAASIASAEHAEMIAAVTELTATQRDAANLYTEVESYELAALAVGARAGRGRLRAGFAAVLEAMPMPSDVFSPGEQAAFRAEIAELVSHFEREATRDIEAAVSAGASLSGDSEVAAWVAAACETSTMRALVARGC